jgi:hypothetical protein
MTGSKSCLVGVEQIARFEPVAEASMHHPFSKLGDTREKGDWPVVVHLAWVFPLLLDRDYFGSSPEHGGAAFQPRAIDEMEDPRSSFLRQVGEQFVGGLVNPRALAFFQ